ncbi:MAG: fibronectin type III domain-containing protein [Clostridiales bacterium]|nr:fibronectin type III domain-containing protein [Clostridiales bacterium]
MLRCGNNSLSKLDVSKNTSLLYLFCYQNSLTSLDVSNNTELVTFYCGDNKLTSLDVSKNTKLTTLTCYKNNLSSIDVSKNMELVIFNCFSNAFSVLDVTNNTKIETMNLVDQTVAVTATYSDGYYRISLADLVGKDNISNVSVETADVSISGNYLVYKNKLSSLVYNYTVKNATISKAMNVTLNITVGSSSSFTASLSTCEISSLTNVAKGIKIKWNQVSGASGYIIYRKTTTGSYSKVKTIKSGSTVSYTDKKIADQNGTVYTYKVIPYSGSTKGSGTEVTTARLTGISLTSVKNSAAGKAKVKWTATTNVDGYQIQYSTSSSFASGKKKTVSGASKSSKTLTGLVKGSTYYVRIRTYKTVNGTKYYSAWSSKLKVKITK